METIGGNLPQEAIPENDFLHIAEDPNQYKFHNAASNLTLVGRENL